MSSSENMPSSLVPHSVSKGEVFIGNYPGSQSRDQVPGKISEMDKKSGSLQIGYKISMPDTTREEFPISGKDHAGIQLVARPGNKPVITFGLRAPQGEYEASEDKVAEMAARLRTRGVATADYTIGGGQCLVNDMPVVYFATKDLDPFLKAIRMNERDKETLLTDVREKIAAVIPGERLDEPQAASREKDVAASQAKK